MRQMKVDCEIDLENLFVTLDNTKLYGGRPEMVLVKMNNGRNLQIFRSGVIQILGALSHSDAVSMRYEVKHRLKKLAKMENCQMSDLTLKNMVVSAQLSRNVSFRNIKTGNKTIQYDGETFPAALITKWRPAHVSVFRNGKVVITGLKTQSHTYFILNSLLDYLTENSLFV